MTGKADFTEEEWELVLSAPASAGLLVSTAQRGGTFREAFSIAKAYSEARSEHGESALLDEIVSGKPKIDRTRHGSVEELKASILQQLRDAVTLLEQKAMPEELDDYRRFVLSLAERVAGAKEEGAEPVSDTEREAIGQIAEVLGTSAG
ncbi:MAG: hypothetical protein AABM29_01805 [Actinomycetota bacterium]